MTIFYTWIYWILKMIDGERGLRLHLLSYEIAERLKIRLLSKIK